MFFTYPESPAPNEKPPYSAIPEAPYPQFRKVEE